MGLFREQIRSKLSGCTEDYPGLGRFRDRIRLVGHRSARRITVEIGQIIFACQQRDDGPLCDRVHAFPYSNFLLGR